MFLPSVEPRKAGSPPRGPMDHVLARKALLVAMAAPRPMRSARPLANALERAIEHNHPGAAQPDQRPNTTGHVPRPRHLGPPVKPRALDEAARTTTTPLAEYSGLLESRVLRVGRLIPPTTRFLQDATALHYVNNGHSTLRPATSLPTLTIPRSSAPLSPIPAARLQAPRTAPGPDRGARHTAGAPAGLGIAEQAMQGTWMPLDLPASMEVDTTTNTAAPPSPDAEGLPSPDAPAPSSPLTNGSNHKRRRHIVRPPSRTLSDDAIITHLGALKWFAALSRLQLDALRARARCIAFARYSTIIRHGAVGSTFYLLLDGRVRVLAEEHGISFVLPDHSREGRGRRYFGEAALISATKREATVVAIDDCHVLAIHKEDLLGMPVDVSEIKNVVCAKMLEKVPPLRGLPTASREALGELLQVEVRTRHQLPTCP